MNYSRWGGTLPSLVASRRQNTGGRLAAFTATDTQNHFSVCVCVCTWVCGAGLAVVVIRAGGVWGGGGMVSEVAPYPHLPH